MNITDYFLKHPVIAVILNILILFVGLLSFNELLVREYPEVHFPKVNVYVSYPNASPELIEMAVTDPLEDGLAGVEGLETITSESKYGECIITLSFKNGISIDKSIIAIREAIGLVTLPKEVDPPRIERKKASDVMPFMVISLESTAMDFAELTHYANLNLKNAFRSVQGVSSIDIWGQPYTYTIKLDSKKMYTFGVNVDDVMTVLRRSHVALPAGQFQNAVPVTLNAQMKSASDYDNLVVKEKGEKPAVLLKYIADVSLEKDDRKFRVKINGKPGLCIAINRTNDSNPLDVSDHIKKVLHHIQETLPTSIKMNLVSDQAAFVRQSIKNVEKSILEAVICVIVVIFFFLRNFWAIFIPLVAIPLSLVGSFLFLKIFGFSINILTLLAMVLAIGLVVDDAIVVLENIQRYKDKGLDIKEAARMGAKEIRFSIIAMTFTLTSVYAPFVFIRGAIGDLFIEFAVALSGSVIISGFVALSLSPFLCAKVLKSTNKTMGSFIDRWLETLTEKYRRILSALCEHPKVSCLVLLGALGLMVCLMITLPRETAPKEDRSAIGVWIPPIPGKDINGMEEKMNQVETAVGPIKDAQHDLFFVGNWGASLWFPLKDQEDRDSSAQKLVETIRSSVKKVPSLDALVWSHDSGLPGLEENEGGGNVSIIISTTDSYAKLFESAEKLRQLLDTQPIFENTKHDLKLDTPGYRIDFDPNILSKLAIMPVHIAQTVSVFFSGDQTLPFSKEGVRYLLTVIGKQSPWNLNELYITNKFGHPVSLGTIASLVPTSDPDKLYHHNQMRSLTLTTDLKKGVTPEKGMKVLWTLAKETLPNTYKYEWTGSIKALLSSSGAMSLMFILSIIFIYAILAIQFESFIDPLIILGTVPLGCLGGLVAIWVTGGSLNIYSQIGLITLVGLISKHGILVVEFVNQLQKDRPLKEALIDAAALRLRPILMTTGAMVFGAIPLVMSTGAGHEPQQSLGVILVGGLSVGTLFTLFLLPTVSLWTKGRLKVKID